MFDKDSLLQNAVIKVIGVGGCGGNAINTMIESGVVGVEFIAANTDVQALQSNLAPIKIQLGRELTKGLGAGANPDIGRDAALEDKAILQEVLQGADMVFITAGMGGGTGTGAAPIIAQVARELGALTVGVVTKPFNFEGKKRRVHGDNGIQNLRSAVDTLITVPNQRLLSIAPQNMSMIDGFKVADDVLRNAVKGISDIINVRGVVNVDFADVKTIMSEMGMALMGIGLASGPNRAAEAARAAISSPLLEDVDIEGATGILINITGSSAMTLHEISEASTLIQEAAHEDANIIFGAVVDEELGDALRVTVIATGFDNARVSFPEGMAKPFANTPATPAYNMGGRPQTQPNHHGMMQNNMQRPHQQPQMMQQQMPQQNPYDTRGQRMPSYQQQQPQMMQQQQRMQQPQAPQAYGRQGFETQDLQRTPTMRQGFVPPQNMPDRIPPVAKSEYEELTRWTLELAQNSEQTIADPQEACEPALERGIGYPEAQAEARSEHDTESAFRLAKELGEIEIDETDFETPAFLRKKDESNKNV